MRPVRGLGFAQKNRGETMIRPFVAAIAFVAKPRAGGRADGLTLPPGFHASVVADGLGPSSHGAARQRHLCYPSRRDQPSGRMWRCTWGPIWSADRAFAGIDQGTGIRIYKGYL